MQVRPGPTTEPPISHILRRLAATLTATVMLAGAFATTPTTASPPAEQAQVETVDYPADRAEQIAAYQRADRHAREVEAQVAAQAAAVAAQAAEAKRAAAAQAKTATTSKKTIPAPPKKVAGKKAAPPKQYGPAKVPGNLAAVVAYANRQVGKSYRWAASGPEAFDCSGLAVAAYRQIGITLPHQTTPLAKRGRAVSRADLRPGDLVFPSSSHVGIYVGGGMMVHASTPKSGVKRSNVYAFAYARRIVG